MPARFDLVAPRADALMESLRATGYSLPDAVSDIIDNSITAGGPEYLDELPMGGSGFLGVDSRRWPWYVGVGPDRRNEDWFPEPARGAGAVRPRTLRPGPQDSINLPGQVPDRCNACLEAEGDEHPAMGPGPPRLHRRLATPECPGQPAASLPL